MCSLTFGTAKITQILQNYIKITPDSAPKLVNNCFEVGSEMVNTNELNNGPQNEPELLYNYSKTVFKTTANCLFWLPQIWLSFFTHDSVADFQTQFSSDFVYKMCEFRIC